MMERKSGLIRVSEVFCQYCKTRESKEGKMPKCSSCCHSHYCSKECQKKDWKRHKQFCTPQEPMNKEESQFHKYFSRWRGRVMMHTVYLLSETFGAEIIRNGNRPTKLLCINVSFDATVRSMEVYEAFTVDWNHIGGDLKTLFDNAYARTCRPGFVSHAIGVVWKRKVFCNPFIAQKNVPLSGVFKNVEACLDFMGEIKKQPRASIIRRIGKGLNQLRQLNECKIFLRSALNMDTILPLNQTHFLVVTIKTEKGNLIQLVSFQLLKTRDVLNYTNSRLAEVFDDSELDLLNERILRRNPNRLPCLFFEQGILSTTMFKQSIATGSTLEAWESQVIARDHFQKLNDLIQKSN